MRPEHEHEHSTSSTPIVSATSSTLMLPTRSLPPQFLLPSWTAADLAQAVQRSYISTTATKSFQIKKYNHGSGYVTIDPDQATSQEPQDPSKPRRRRATKNTPDLHLGVRHFKPFVGWVPRPIPTPLPGFYFGKKYNGPGGEKLEGDGNAPSEPNRPENIQQVGERPTATTRQQRSGPGILSRTTSHIIGEQKPEPSSEHPSEFELVQAEYGELLADREDEPKVSIGSREVKLRKFTNPKPGSAFIRWQPQRPSQKARRAAQRSLSPEKAAPKPQGISEEAMQQVPLAPNTSQEAIQQTSSLPKAAAEPQMLDMAGRWTMDPASKFRSTKPLPWESDEPLPNTVQQFKASTPDVPRSVSTKIRVTPYEQDQPKETMSLFQELFPEESKTRQAAIRLAEERLDKLPAFEWDMDENFDQNWQSERQEKKAKLYEIPSRTEPTDTSPQPIRYTTTIPLREETSIRTRRHEPSVVVMDGLSKYLEESDFFRIGSRGNHIEGWTSGILKVIPARDHTTLQPLGYYYLLFSSDAAARAYMDSTHRLHMLGKNKGPSSMPFMPPPLGSLREGENIKDLLRGFSVLPRQNKLSMRLLNKPYRPGVLEMIAQGGPPALASRRAKGEALVLFSVDVGTITYYDILYALKDDGRQRNMLWRFAGGKEVDITAVTLQHRPVKDEAQRRDFKASDRFKAPEKYIFAMKDVQEARRFVREWHRRSIEGVKRGKSEELGQERPATVSAELLW